MYLLHCMRREFLIAPCRSLNYVPGLAATKRFGSDSFSFFSPLERRSVYGQSNTMFQSLVCRAERVWILANWLRVWAGTDDGEISYSSRLSVVVSE